MKQNRRWSTGIIIFLLIALCTACTGSHTASEHSGAATGNSGTSETAVSNNTRVVASEKGNVSIPANPQRVVGLSVVYPEFLYALGVKPVAVQNYHPEFPGYLQDALKDTLKTGLAQTPNFEAILSTQPDLIIAPAWWSDKDYDQLTAIAPTVLLPQRDNWRDELRDIAEVLGKKELAEKVISDLKIQEADAKKKLDSLVGDETVMYMMIMADEIVIYGKNSDRGKFIHQELGLNPVNDFPQSEMSVSISLEKIPEYNPDHIILQMDDESSDKVQQRYKEMINSTLWKNMTAVKNNHVYMMGGKEWFSLGMSPLADHNAVNDVLHAFEKKAH